MSVKTYLGTIEKGQVRLTTSVFLAEQTKVYVVAPEFELVTTKSKFDLNEMIARMPTYYFAVEESFGEPVGKEER